MRLRPLIHGRDHEHGGADPTRIVYEDVGGDGGGGGAFVPQRERLSGSSDSAAAFSGTLLTWVYAAGDTLLDLTDAQRPVFIDTGVYAVSAAAHPLSALPAGYYWELDAGWAPSDPDGFLFVQQAAQEPGAGVSYGPTVFVSVTAYMTAGQDMEFTASNRSNATRSFGLYGAIVQRIA